MIAVQAITANVPGTIEVAGQAGSQERLQVGLVAVLARPLLPIEDEAEGRPDRQVVAGPPGKRPRPSVLRLPEVVPVVPFAWIATVPLVMVASLRRQRLLLVGFKQARQAPQPVGPPIVVAPGHVGDVPEQLPLRLPEVARSSASRVVVIAALITTINEHDARDVTSA